jgi:hypothetical protein
MAIFLLSVSHILAIYIASKLTAKSIYKNIKDNYDVFESVRIIEPKSDKPLYN